nr:retrovirus-related Pol polyprotein from transposon TNT 1-94 [Tanacetum cinerariifolium]
MTAGQRMTENQWTGDEIKAANLDQRLKSLIMSVLPDDQMNSNINCLTAKSTWDDLILYHESPSDVKESKDFQDSLGNEEDTRSSHEYLNDLKEEYQARSLLAKSKRFFKKASMVKNKGLIAEAYEWDEEEVSSYDNEMVEVKVLMAVVEENDAFSKEGARNDEWVKISMRKCISEQIPSQKKRILGVDQLIKDPSSSGLKDLVFVKSSAGDTKVTIPGVERPWLSEAEGFILPNHDTSRILPSESQRNTTNSSVTDSSVTDCDSIDESSVCSIPLSPLKKLDGAKPISGPKTIKSILRSKYTFKAEALKDVAINEPSLAPAKGNKSSSASKVHSTPAGKLKSVKIKDDHPLAIVMKEHFKSLGRMSSRPNIPRPSKRFFPPFIHCGGIGHLSNEYLYYPICKLCRSYDHVTNGHNRIISLERKINPRNPQHAFKKYEACGSPNHTTTDHYEIEWFKRGEARQAKKAEALKSTPFCSAEWFEREQPGPKVVFGDDSTCTTKGYGSIKCNGIVFTKFNEKRGTIFNSNKEIVMIAHRVRDVYVLDMTSSAQESCFF